jgi:hypothetical protein
MFVNLNLAALIPEFEAEAQRASERLTKARVALGPLEAEYLSVWTRVCDLVTVGPNPAAWAPAAAPLPPLPPRELWDVDASSELAEADESAAGE